MIGLLVSSREQGLSASQGLTMIAARIASVFYSTRTTSDETKTKTKGYKKVVPEGSSVPSWH